MKQATTISLDRRLLEAARREAKAQRRSLSAQLEVWMEEKLSPPSPEPIRKGKAA